MFFSRFSANRLVRDLSRKRLSTAFRDAQESQFLMTDFNGSARH
jgi:hypothetical protein